MCMPFRLMERICPFGRMLAVPPPFSATCLPGAGRLAVFATFAFPPLPMLPPEVLPIAELPPDFPPAVVPFLPVVPVPVLPVVPVPVLPTPGFVPVVDPGLDPVADECVAVPGRDPVVDECVPVPVEGRAVDECDAGAECDVGAECDGGAECEGALGFGGGGDDFF